MDYGQRHKYVRKLRGMTQVQVAKITGIEQSTISKIERGVQSTGKTTIQLALAYNVDPVWLDTGVGDMEVKKYTENQMDSVRQPNGLYHVPIITFDICPQWTKIDLPSRENLKKGVSVTTKKVSEDAFAFVQKGDSMMTSTGESIAEGAEVIVDPAVIPVDGHIVLVDQGGSEPLLRKLTRQGITQYLKPLNPAYPVIEFNENWAIIGVAVALNITLC